MHPTWGVKTCLPLYFQRFRTKVWARGRGSNSLVEGNVGKVEKRWYQETRRIEKYFPNEIAEKFAPTRHEGKVPRPLEETTSITSANYFNHEASCQKCSRQKHGKRQLRG